MFLRAQIITGVCIINDTRIPATCTLWRYFNPQCACTVRVTIVAMSICLCVCVCLSVKPHLTSGASVHCEHPATYSVVDEGQKIVRFL